jgi:hypothetical protein
MSIDLTPNQKILFIFFEEKFAFWNQIINQHLWAGTLDVNLWKLACGLIEEFN